MKIACFTILALASLNVPAFGASVSWNSPNHTSVGTTVLYDCTYNNPGITAQYMKLWVDGTAVLTVHGANRLTYLAEYSANETHRATCQGNDGVNPTTNSAPLTLTIGNNLREYLSSEQRSWTQCNQPGCLAQDSWGQPDPVAATGQTSSPALNAPAQFFDTQWTTSSDQYQNMYWFQKVTSNPIGSLAKTWVMRFDVQMASGDRPQAFEYGMTQCTNGYRYRMALQSNDNGTTWKIYHPTASSPKWKDTAIDFQGFTPGWHRVIFVGRTDSSARTMEIQAISIDGALTAVSTNNVVAADTDTCTADWNSDSFQIDMNHTLDDHVRAYVDNLDVLYEQ